ncbi:MAG: hypothetical protein Fur0032_08220 [Terrimicrobiaceae bacterium]
MSQRESRRGFTQDQAPAQAELGAGFDARFESEGMFRAFQNARGLVADEEGIGAVSRAEVAGLDAGNIVFQMAQQILPGGLGEMEQAEMGPGGNEGFQLLVAQPMSLSRAVRAVTLNGGGVHREERQ